VDESGRNWSIAMVNRHPEIEVSCTVRMKDLLLDGRYRATILAGSTPDAFNDIENPNRVAPVKTKLTFARGVVSLLPHSLTIVKIPLGCTATQAK
jgi:hypothetical protein